MSTSRKFQLRSLFVGVGLALLVAGEPAGAQTVVNYDSHYAIALPLFMDTRANLTTSLPGAGWYTVAHIQNTSASVTAKVRVTATPKQGGTGTSSGTFEVGPNSVVMLRPDVSAIPGQVGIAWTPTGNFEGSLLIESDHALVVLGELSNVQRGSMGVGGGTAKGFFNGIVLDESNTSLSFSMMKSGFNSKSSVVYVKNSNITGDDTATLTLKTNDGMTYTASAFLSAGQSRAFTGTDFKSGSVSWTKTCSGGANDALPGLPAQPGAPCFGAVQLTKSHPGVTFAAIAVQRSVAATSPSPSVHVAGFQATTHSNACATFRNAYQTTARSGVSLMNAGSSSVDITLKLINAATQTQYTQIFPGVPSGRSVVASYWAGTIGGFPDGALGAATITSTLAGTSTADNHIVAAVSESGVGTTESAYQCMEPRTRLVAPIVKFDYVATNHPIPATSEVRIFNPSGGSGTLTIKYLCSGQTYTAQQPIAGKGSVEINSASFAGGIPAGRICSAEITSNVGIVGTVTERSSSSVMVDDATYELQSPRDNIVFGNPCPGAGPLSDGVPIAYCPSGGCCPI